MFEKRLYIIAGCNGAGKTSASFTILPEFLDCKEFVNADEIARGLSPFQPEKASIEAGRIMLNRINNLIAQNRTFAFETTLSTRSYQNKIIEAQEAGYRVTLLFFWLESIDLAKERIKTRVAEGGHNIPQEVIERRYTKGIKNLFGIYIQIVDGALIFDNSDGDPKLIAEKPFENSLKIINPERFTILKNQYDRS